MCETLPSSHFNNSMLEKYFQTTTHRVFTAPLPTTAPSRLHGTVTIFTTFFLVLLIAVSTSSSAMDNVVEFTKDGSAYAISRKDWEGKAILGEGGAAIVYRVVARKVESGEEQEVAVKLSLRADRDAKVKEEGELLASLPANPSVPPVYANTTIGERAALVLPLFGESVAETILARPNKRHPVDGAITFAASLFRAVAHSGRHGVVHRDLKPWNLLTAADGSKAAVLVDFGTGTRDSQDQDQDYVAGSPGFGAPESVLSAKKIDGRADIFSAALCTGAILLGRPLLPAADFQPEESYRRRLLADLADLLGPIGDDDVGEMTDATLAQADKPRGGPSPTRSLASQLGSCGLGDARRTFFVDLLGEALAYRPSRRPEAFAIFRRLVGEMTATERSCLPALTEEEKEEARRVCDGEQGAAAAFGSLYQA